MSDRVFQHLTSIKTRTELVVLKENLTSAIVNGDLENLKKILRKKSSLYLTRDSSGRTVAHLAAIHRRQEILK